MKQILQNLRTGLTEVADIPAPASQRGHLLIRTHRTLVSTGTERMLVEFGRAGWLEKARQQPDKVRAVLDKLRTDGIAPTIETVFNKLDQPLPLGYCNVGHVLEVGAGVTAFARGDRVVSNGKHAEVVSVPANLCARIPDGVSDEQAAFTVIGAIGLQGIRLAQPTLGESFVVIGLGLIGLATVQLLRAHGCRVLGVDLDAARLALAERFGAEVVDASGGDPVAAANAFSRFRGVDGVILSAATKSSEPVHQAALMCRKRGRIVLVGVTGLELSRADFYEKELTFQVSCSYGPGRYDPSYEEQGVDYPVGFVRWTEQRNLEAVLDMMADGRIDVAPLISHRFKIEDAAAAYDLVAGDSPSLGIVLQYAGTEARSDESIRRSTVRLAGTRAGASRMVVAIIGSGNYATSVLIPAFRAAGVRLKTVVSSGGVSGFHAARKFGFEQTTTDTDSVFVDPDVNTVVIATRHDTHAMFAARALAAGKHVFVEKPLALSMAEVDVIEQAARGRILMIGFNRRFAPHVRKMETLLRGSSEPKAFVMIVNAGFVPAAHWTRDGLVGGGRIIGEACHFIDLLRYLAGARISGFQAGSLSNAGDPIAADTCSITLRFDDGSIGTIHYFANGHKAVPKERLEVFVGGRILRLDNYRHLVGHGWPGFDKMSLWRQDKGQKDCVAAFARAVTTGAEAPIPPDEIFEVSRAAIGVAEALR